jgi:hypothetical protein
MVYGTAMKNVWDNFESKHGPVANRWLALVNMRYYSDTLGLFVYMKVNAVVTADVVEFDRPCVGGEDRNADAYFPEE